MKNISKFKVEKGIIIPLILFMIISITTIYATRNLLTDYYDNLWIKQGIWYVIGFGIAYLMMSFGNKFLYQNAYILYVINIILLILVLFIGKEVNGSMGWFEIPKIGSLQPAEFMKVVLIITLGRMINDFNETNANPSIKTEFIFLLKIGLIFLIPAVLTFIQPDTGAVIIYLFITIVMLFIGGIRKRWFIILFGSVIILGGMFLLLFFLNQDLFIQIFGTNFFYRIDRLLNWSTGFGTQLTNSLISIGSSGMFGHGFNSIPIYFPEPHTDFIFSSFASCYGLLGSIVLILIIAYFDINLIKSASKTYDKINRYVIAGIIGMLLYQQLQNIGMTIGLLPITGITLPFISYGGSSLISYFILVGIIFNVSNESLRYTN